MGFEHMLITLIFGRPNFPKTDDFGKSIAENHQICRFKFIYSDKLSILSEYMNGRPKGTYNMNIFGLPILSFPSILGSRIEVCLKY